MNMHYICKTVKTHFINKAFLVKDILALTGSQKQN